MSDGILCNSARLVNLVIDSPESTAKLKEVKPALLGGRQVAKKGLNIEIVSVAACMVFFMMVSRMLKGFIPSPWLQDFTYAIGLVAGVWAGQLMFRYILARKGREILDQLRLLGDRPSDVLAVASFYRGHPNQRHVGFRSLALRLAELGRIGEVVRICGRSAGPVGAPLALPFEPQILNQNDRGFENVELLGGAAHDLPDQDKSFWLFGQRGRPILITLIVAVLVLEYMRRTGGFTLEFLTVILVSVLLGVVGFATQRQRQWFLVPGGLVVREFKALGSTSEAHLFTADNSVLIAGQTKGNAWHVSVASADRKFDRNCSQREADLLVRAWCSPLAPPSIEQLSDLR